MSAWSGLVYAATCGAAGSLVIYGGGHADYPYNEVYRYDVATRLWSRISDPVYPTYTDGSNMRVDSEYGEYWNNANFTTVHVGQVSADHTYGHMVWLPSGSIGGDSAGYFFTPGVSSAVNNSGSRSWPHYMPLSNPVWARGGAKLGSSPLFGPALYDSARNRVVVLPSTDFNKMGHFVNCATQAVGTFSIGAPGTQTYYGTGGYDSASDLYMSANVGNAASGASLNLINPTSGATRLATISGDPTSGNGGWDWVQSWGAWVYYPGTGQTVYKLKKPADPWNGTWVMTSQTMTGETAQAKYAGAPHFSRFRYIAPAGCFLWASSTANLIQAFSVTAP